MGVKVESWECSTPTHSGCDSGYYCSTLSLYDSSDDVCDDPASPEFDPATGQCIAPECTEAEGQIYNTETQQCECPYGEVINPFTNACEIPCPAVMNFDYTYPENSPPTCMDGCGVTTCGTQITTAEGTSFGKICFTGDFCDGSPDDPPPPDLEDPDYVDPGEVQDDSPVTCPAGTAYATFDGVSKCWPIRDPDNTYEDHSTTTEQTTDTTNTTTTTTTTDTTTTTTNPDGSTTTVTETTQQSQSTEEGELTITDFNTDGPESFWESQYSDGMSGIWQQHSQALQQTELVSWLNGWGFPNSGSCPTFSFNFDLGIANFGTQSIGSDLYCYVFPIVRLIVIFSSLLLARRLVFGG